MKSLQKRYAKMCMGKETIIRNPISQYRKNQDEEKACDPYHQEYQDGLTLVTQLRSCAARKDLYLGSKIHAEISRRGLHKTNVFVGNTLVSMYAKCGALSKAQQVFDELPGQDVISWTALISGYCQYGCGEEALACFEQMQHEDVSPNAMTFSCILKACGSIGAIEKGKELHFEIERSGLLGKDAVLGSGLVDMYAKCGALSKAQQVFNMLAVRNIVSWTALITGYCQFGYGEEAIVCFDQMEQEGLPPNAVTFACILNACGNTGAAEKGKQVHAKVFGLESVANTCELGNALVDMYSKCGALTKAQQVFDELPVQDVVSWTSLISGYFQYGHVEEAFNNFNHMKHEGFAPNAVTFSCILNACSSIKATGKGREVHAEMIRNGLLENDLVLGNALLDMYAKCGAVAKAQQVFDELSHPNLVCWTALITGYCQHGHGKEALNCFEKMKALGLSPDAVTFACILKACGSVGATEKGEEIHAEIVRVGWLEKVRVLRSALIDMYAKCGALAKAQEVFDKLPIRDTVSLNALIAGFCQYGHSEKALQYFEQLEDDGLSPDALTFLYILKACSSIGAAVKGQMYYENMSMDYGILPTAKHRTCMVNLLSHAGYLHEAMAMMKKLPPFRYLPAWIALLGACQRWGNMKLGRVAFEHLA